MNDKVMGNIPIIRKDNDRLKQKQFENWMKSCPTNADVQKYLAPLHSSLQIALVNISALVSILIEKDVFTEEEFFVKLQEAENTFMNMNNPESAEATEKNEEMD